MALTVVNSDTLVVGPDLKTGVFHLATQPRKSRVCVTVRGVNSELTPLSRLGITIDALQLT
ncbi:hypothetical protein LROSRS0_1617 [Furfurilactobacillus rossiae]|nr:hypothetical protein LROSRS0_1617 [Furfurilactobacillus rossiae]